MKLTKDEARILADMVAAGKYSFNEVNFRKEGLFQAIGNLERKLRKAGKDERRNGRTSMNDFDDCLKRFIAANQQPKI